MVSSTTTFRISADANMEPRTTLKTHRARRRINDLFIVMEGGRAPVRPALPDSIFFLFPRAGVNFLQCSLGRCPFRRRRGNSPSRKVRAARDQPRASFVRDIGPGPLNENQQPVAEADQKQDV